MPEGSPDPKELGFYFALAQVGTEMVVPLGLGVALDYYLNWMPWGSIVGAVLGFVGGLAHLLVLLRRRGPLDPPRSARGPR
jgi:F0F1-type ATP synthase assembly protein I